MNSAVCGGLAVYTIAQQDYPDKELEVLLYGAVAVSNLLIKSNEEREYKQYLSEAGTRKSKMAIKLGFRPVVNGGGVIVGKVEF